MPISLIAFDADDTLWHNESYFHLSQERFCELISDHGEKPALIAHLETVERRNLKLYGYGVKGFTLSLIETALEITAGKVSQQAISEILMIGRDLLSHPIEPLPGVIETLQGLHGNVRLALITKGDLIHQEQKVAGSGLADYFDAIEIVSEKDPATYARIFARQGVATGEAAMVGNSLRSDVLPVIEAGGWGIHVPYHITWALERVENVPDHERLVTLETIAEVRDWFSRLR